MTSDSNLDQLQVICVGYGRTGTESMKVALDKLGYKCYHFKELLQYKDDQTWIDIINQNEDERNFNKSIFAARDYKACADFPCVAYYEQLMKENPNAKVILTIRDNPEIWYQSSLNTIYPMCNVISSWLFQLFQSNRNILQILNTSFWNNPKHLNGKFLDKKYAINAYEKHNENVKTTVPEDKLLVFNVKQGWKPICKFLEKDVPNEPFPRTNSTKQFRQAVNFMSGMVYFVNGIVVASVVVGGYFLSTKVYSAATNST